MFACMTHIIRGWIHTTPPLHRSWAQILFQDVCDYLYPIQGRLFLVSGDVMSSLTLSLQHPRLPHRVYPCIALWAFKPSPDILVTSS
jgi:hypothetical protein